MVDIRLPVVTFKVLTFRKAKLSDATDLYEWVNEPEVRANSFSTQVISWENHVRWLEQRLSNPDVIILLFLDENALIGQVRFEKKMNTFLIDYSVLKNKRGKGFGVKMLKSAIQYLREIKSENLPLFILAEVKLKSLPSIKVFKKLGFKEQFISEYAIKTAIDSGLFTEVMVSTDDAEIAEIAVSAMAKVPFLRSREASNDIAITVAVLLEVLRRYAELGKTFDYVCCLYPVMPLTAYIHLKKGWQRLQDGFDSVMPILPYSFPIWRSVQPKGERLSWIWPEYAAQRSQDLPEAFHDAVQWYWVKTNKLLETEQLLIDNSGFIVLQETEAQDVDNESDWALMELKYELQYVQA